jgi:hypothetical protein
MQNIELELTLPEQDIYLVEIEKQIAQKRNFLLQRSKQLEESAKENMFLNNVKEDYHKYHQFILKQKQHQIRAMQMLDQYLNDLMISGKMTQRDVLQSKKDQQEILSEIDKIKQDLDGIILSTKSY